MKKNVGANAGNVGQQVYEAKVGLEALERAGRNLQLKGVAHEVMYRDALNLENLGTNRVAVLTRSTTAVRDDVLLKEGAKVVGRFQLKDTPASAAKVVKQVESGKYAGTRLVGTPETVSRYRAAGGEAAKSMTSSGISSSATERVANKVLGNLGSGKNLCQGAASAGAAGAAVGAAVEAVSAVGDLLDGQIDAVDCVGRVATAGVVGATTSAAGAMAASAASAGTATVLAGAGLSTVATGTVVATAVAAAPVVAAVGAAIAVGCAVSSLLDSLFDW